MAQFGVTGPPLHSGANMVRTNNNRIHKIILVPIMVRISNNGIRRIHKIKCTHVQFIKLALYSVESIHQYSDTQGTFWDAFKP